MILTLSYVNFADSFCLMILRVLDVVRCCVSIGLWNSFMFIE